MNKEGILEGLLFVTGDDGLTLKQISELLSEDIPTCKEILLSLKLSTLILVVSSEPKYG